MQHVCGLPPHAYRNREDDDANFWLESLDSNGCLDSDNGRCLIISSCSECACLKVASCTTDAVSRTEFVLATVRGTRSDLALIN